MKFVRLILIVILSMVAAGCSGTRGDLLNEGRLGLEVGSSEYAEVAAVSAWAEQGQTVVSGWVRRTGMASGLSGHVDVAFLDRQGNVLHQTAASSSVGRIPQRGQRHAHFIARLPEMPAAAERVRVRYHGGSAMHHEHES